jgi:hypothetical protein
MLRTLFAFKLAASIFGPGAGIKPAWTGTMELSDKPPSPTCALCNKKIGAIRLGLIYCPDEDESRGSR